MDLVQKSFPVIQQHEILEQAVNARELHGFLEVGKDFSNWIKGRISKYDFIILCQTSEYCATNNLY